MLNHSIFRSVATVLLATSFGLISCTALVQPSADPKRQTIDQTIQSAMLQAVVPGVSVAVIDGGRIAWVNSYGVRASTENILVDDNTQFQIASISKPMTALAAMRLVDSKVMNLDGNINSQLKSWQIPASALTQKNFVSLRQLLTHRAGLSTPGFLGYTADEPIPTVLQILNGQKPANSPAVQSFAEPGSRTEYSGGGYTVIQQAMQDSTGKPFINLMNDLVFAPARMTHTSIYEPSQKHRWAIGHDRKDQNLIPIAGGYQRHPELAAAAVWSTASDVAQFMLEFQRATQGKGAFAFQNIELAREMIYEQGDTWGLGIILEGYGANQRLSHSGANRGFRAYASISKDGQRGVVVLTNSNSGQNVVNATISAVAKNYAWPETLVNQKPPVALDGPQLAAWVGHYGDSRSRIDPRPELEIATDSNQLLARQGTAPWVVLNAQTDTSFSAVLLGNSLHFDRAGGTVTINEAGQSDRVLTRKLPPEPNFKKMNSGANPIYLRGSFNDWSLATPFSRSANSTEWSVKQNFKRGKYEFKIASQDFRALDLGGSPINTAINLDQYKPLFAVGSNLSFDVPQDGNYRFSLNLEGDQAILSVHAAESRP
jgi:CubicO group peptidase (beta-lactamase class C family)